MWFLNSPLVGGLIAGLATLGTGWFAIEVFRLQKKNEKVNAAISILFEIRNAEGKVDIIAEKLHANNLLDLPSVLPTNNWRKYSHLFAKDFDEDELKLINTFYNSCEIIEDLVAKQNNFIWIAAEERARVAQKLLADIHIEFQKNIATGGNQTVAQNTFNAEKKAVTEYYTDEAYFYAPAKTTNGLKFHIDSLQKITATTCGKKLKDLSNV